jgi:TonB family protein
VNAAHVGGARALRAAGWTRSPCLAGRSAIACRRAGAFALLLLLTAPACTPRTGAVGTRLPERVVERMRRAHAVSVVRLGAEVNGNAVGQEVFTGYEVLNHGGASPAWEERFTNRVIASRDSAPAPPAASNAAVRRYGVRFASRAHAVEVIVDLDHHLLDIFDDGRLTTRRSFDPADTSFAGLARAAFPDDSTFAEPAHVAATGFERLPEPRHTVPATYPHAASSRGIEGVVLLNVRVDSLGQVREVRVVRSIPALDAAAVAAVRRWTFEPARANSHAVEAWTGVPVRFSLGR